MRESIAASDASGRYHYALASRLSAFPGDRLPL
jgi:hypothetical protein